MGLDLSKLVLGPAMTTWARAVLIDPRASGLSGAPPYAARGIFSSTPVDVMLEGGGVLSDQRTSLGIRLSDFETPPVQNDRVQVAAPGVAAPVTGDPWYRVTDVNDDGQGGRRLMLATVVDNG